MTTASDIVLIVYISVAFFFFYPLAFPPFLQHTRASLRWSTTTTVRLSAYDVIMQMVYSYCNLIQQKSNKFSSELNRSFKFKILFDNQTNQTLIVNCFVSPINGSVNSNHMHLPPPPPPTWAFVIFVKYVENAPSVCGASTFIQIPTVGLLEEGKYPTHGTRSRFYLFIVFSGFSYGF